MPNTFESVGCEVGGTVDFHMRNWVIVRVLAIDHSDPRQTGRVVAGGLVADCEDWQGFGRDCEVRRTARGDERQTGAGVKGRACGMREELGVAET